MVLCSVPWCKSRSDHQNWKRSVNEGNDGVKITFHRFPRDATTRSLWSDILGINSPSISSGARICAKHFEEKYLDRSSLLQVRLRPNALPRVKEELKIESGIQTNLLDAIMEKQNEPSDPDQHSEIEALHHVYYSQTMQASSSVPVTSILKLSMSQPSMKPSTSTADKSTMTSFEQDYWSPEKCRLRKRLEYVKEESQKKIRNLQQKCRRHTDKITALESALKNALKMLREKQSLDED